MTVTDVRDDLKARLQSTIERDAPALTRFAEDIADHPELGFREERTATKVAEGLRALGLTVEEGIGVTGLRARLKMAGEGPTIAVMAELDALPVPDHPRADPKTGAAHACGHNAQLTHLLAVATALVACDAVRELCGTIVFLAVPAEEFVDLEWRAELARAGKIEFLGGKAELIRKGAFADIDIAMMVHASGMPSSNRLSVCWHFNGFVAKQYRFVGKAAHAGGAPFLGINALNAATLAIQAMNAQRETFRDEDHIRVHPIITHGGSSINVVPADVRVETFVRGSTLDTIAAAAHKIDRAAKSGAFAVGAALEIDTLPGYLPLHMDRALGGVFGENAVPIVGHDHYGEVPFIAACTDAGDLSHILPVLHPNHGGYVGGNHTAEFAVSDATDAYITPAKAMAGTLVDLLSNRAERALGIIRAFKPELTPDAYLAKMRAFTTKERFVYD
jgi:amidohydrolase